MKSTFYVQSVELMKRKTHKQVNRIDITCLDSPMGLREYKKNVIKSETVFVLIKLTSSGKTKNISNEQIFDHFIKQQINEL